MSDNPLVCAHHFSLKQAFGTSSTLTYIIVSAFAGGLAGISIDFALFPIDSIKTRLQASSKKIDYTKEAKNVSKYRGFMSAMLASFPCAGVFWCSYEYSKYFLRKHTSGYLNVNIQHMLAAAMGETCQALIRNPFEILKQNLQVGKYPTMLACASDLYQHKGIAGFYSGYYSLLLREIPFSSIQFPFYEMLKMMQIKILAFKLNQPDHLVQLPSLVNAVNGSIAGSISGFLVTPFDVAKTRLMTYAVKEQIPSTSEIIKEVYREEGIQGLYRGAGIRMMYLGVGGFAFFGIYEKIKVSLINVYEE